MLHRLVIHTILLSSILSCASNVEKSPPEDKLTPTEIDRDATLPPAKLPEFDRIIFSEITDTLEDWTFERQFCEVPIENYDSIISILTIDRRKHTKYRGYGKDETEHIMLFLNDSLVDFYELGHGLLAHHGPGIKYLNQDSIREFFISEDLLFKQELQFENAESARKTHAELKLNGTAILTQEPIIRDTWWMQYDGKFAYAWSGFDSRKRQEEVKRKIKSEFKAGEISIGRSFVDQNYDGNSLHPTISNKAVYEEFIKRYLSETDTIYPYLSFEPAFSILVDEKNKKKYSKYFIQTQ